jgi:POT family proton-dependent oligopeptide transporter
LALAVTLLAFLALLQATQVIDVFTAQGLAKAMGVVIVTVTLFYFLFILIAGGLDPVERRRVYVIFFLFVGAALFWAGFEQAGSSLNLFARDYTNRTYFGWVMPAGWFQSVNSSVIIVFAPVIGALWVKLASKNLNPKTPIKFGIGLILMAVGFMVMYYAAKLAVTNGKVGSIWLICAYFFHSIGELTLSPVGLSATTKLAPKRFLGQLMGIWFVGASLGNLIAGLFASGIEPSDATQLPGLFWSVVVFGGIAGLFFILFSPVLQKWTGDIK